MDKKDIWFKAKQYGWGWTPVTKEGWGVTFLFIGALVLLAFQLGENPTEKEIIFNYLLPIALFVLAFIKVAYTHGEKPKWRWGKFGKRK